MTRLGARATVKRPSWVRNRGSIVIGDDVRIFAGTHLVTGPRGRIEMGDRVSIGSRVGIASEASVRIGDDVVLAPGVLILDTDFHSAGRRDRMPEPVPIVIEDGARLDRNVVVLKGSRIRQGAWIAEGSVVSGEIGAHAIASGVPASVVRDVELFAGGDVLQRTCAVVAETFGVAVTPDDGPERIQAWDSLGTLRLLVAIERTFDIALADDALDGVTSVAALADAVRNRIRCRRRDAAHD